MACNALFIMQIVIIFVFKKGTAASVRLPAAK
jgi:hypothetical protein